MPVAELDSVSTFANLVVPRPVGRHMILLCDSVSCYLLGAESLRRWLRTAYPVPDRPRPTTRPPRLLPIVCLGACDHAPAMMVDRT
ncbi:MAG: NAD(P)H-dependent oxidoreductase subunit E [Gammaproteobacteria bacterium]|nr:NAD(P)H-dependent oxidoreductase subunit E [Gammaproteobacteria bacterium]